VRIAGRQNQQQVSGIVDAERMASMMECMARRSSPGGDSTPLNTASVQQDRLASVVAVSSATLMGIHTMRMLATALVLLAEPTRRLRALPLPFSAAPPPLFAWYVLSRRDQLQELILLIAPRFAACYVANMAVSNSVPFAVLHRSLWYSLVPCIRIVTMRFGSSAAILFQGLFLGFAAMSAYRPRSTACT
jgi:hypothetical protein